MGPLITLKVHEQMRAALRAGAATLDCSLDLDRSIAKIALQADHWTWNGQRFAYLNPCKDRTIYYWTGTQFAAVSRYTTALIKLVPTDWGPPTFEIDGIKMLPTAKVSPYADAQRKVALVEPRGKVILDTCGGLGYFAGCCLQAGAARIISFEKHPDVIWLRSLNPWSPAASTSGGEPRLSFTQADVTEQVSQLATASVDAVLHDPPRFGIAGELYAQAFYEQLARVIRRNGRLFHYTGTPNKLTSGRDVPGEVSRRLQQAGFSTRLDGDGVLAVRQRS